MGEDRHGEEEQRKNVVCRCMQLMYVVCLRAYVCVVSPPICYSVLRSTILSLQPSSIFFRRYSLASLPSVCVLLTYIPRKSYYQLLACTLWLHDLTFNLGNLRVTSQGIYLPTPPYHGLALPSISVAAHPHRSFPTTLPFPPAHSSNSQVTADRPLVNPRPSWAIRPGPGSPTRTWVRQG